MIKVFFRGGLGNQMFQYAVARHIELKLGVDLCFDLSWYHYPIKRKFLLGEFSLNYPIVNSRINFLSTILLKAPLYELLGSCPVYRDDGLVFNDDIFGVQDSSVIIGFFQSEKYFKDIEPVIRKDFSFNHLSLSAREEDWLDQIQRTESVAIQVRRGDYIKHAARYAVCSEGYYQRAVKYMRDHLVNPKFYIFSDDLAWCSEVFREDDIHLCDLGTSLDNPIHDLKMMAACKHHILSNSSFAWWGAWLNEYADQVVIVPDRWNNSGSDTSDIPCESWVQISG